MKKFNDVLKTLLPHGKMWTGRNFLKLVDGISYEFDRISAERSSLFTESLPISAIALLSDWERVLNIIPSSTDITARQQKVAATFASTGGNTDEFYLSLARIFDSRATLLKDNSALNFTAGHGRAGDSLGLLTIPKFTAIFAFTIKANADVEAILQKLKPAHVEFRYRFKV